MFCAVIDSAVSFTSTSGLRSEVFCTLHGLRRFSNQPVAEIVQCGEPLLREIYFVLKQFMSRCIDSQLELDCLAGKHHHCFGE